MGVGARVGVGAKRGGGKAGATQVAPPDASRCFRAGRSNITITSEHEYPLDDTCRLPGNFISETSAAIRSGTGTESVVVPW